MTRSEKETLSGPLKVALISTVSPVLTPGLFKHIGQQYPSIALQTEEMLSGTILDKLRKAEVDMGILAGPVREPGFLEIPLYHERFLAYVSPDNPAYAQESIRAASLFEQPVWIIREGLRLLDPRDLKEGPIVNDNGGLTIIPETHTGFILYSQQHCIRPIIDPVPSRTISLVLRSDYIHEAKLNAVVDAVKQIIPGTMLDNVLRKGRLTL